MKFKPIFFIKTMKKKYENYIENIMKTKITTATNEYHKRYTI